MRFGILQFPGSNCDQDFFHAIQNVLKEEAVYLWHKESNLQGADVVIAPGGFSYGDYLRCGAIARFSPVMSEVKKFAAAGGLVLGVCNGFQILTEAGLLPGALLRNRSLKFVCKEVFLRVENPGTPFTLHYHTGEVLRIPIAHGEGITSRSRTCLPVSPKTGRSFSNTPTPTAARRRRPTQTARFATSRGSATKPAMWLG